MICFKRVPSIVSAAEALPGAILVFPVLGLNARRSHCAPTPLALFGRGPQTHTPPRLSTVDMVGLLYNSYRTLDVYGRATAHYQLSRGSFRPIPTTGQSMCEPGAWRGGREAGRGGWAEGFDASVLDKCFHSTCFLRGKRFKNWFYYLNRFMVSGGHNHGQRPTEITLLICVFLFFKTASHNIMLSFIF